ncbi:adenosylcobinamide-phosphate synthase [Alteribacillus persepolensis]|uniref:Cobalamin biosynthesis protein CobD n=1 Tax=Alteribacillus persepolensis TaxID=568899 RepID=A0A1G7ZKP9_9BACI|nr:adenosylcobinamide-phosphate synthase CbiB [Alteribacillus persepolensis]SDH09341.1 adenosylcobinamide-phosphate synthase [Alteribacillus persepolensis]
MSWVILHLLAVTAAYVMDRLFGDPKTAVHPVVLMGKLIQFGETRLNQGRFRKGKGIVFCLISAAFLLAAAIAFTYGAYSVSIWLGVLFEAVIIWLMIGGESMVKQAVSIYESLSNSNLSNARTQTGMIVSRDTSQMEESGIIRAVLESIGENISDSVTAPLFYALIGGAPLAVLYRYINTSDAMLGYTSQRLKQFGWASARFDDVLNLIPARITAAVMTVSVWKIKAATWQEAVYVIKHFAHLHESPNSGYGEAAMAGVLAIRLGGPTPYPDKLVQRPYFGVGKRPVQHVLIAEGITVWHVTILLFISLLWMIGGVIHVMA